MVNTFGILIQGGISNWTKKIVEEYQNNFPDAKILISTWENENVNNIPCKFIKIKPPQFTIPFKSTVNHQKFGTLAGLNELQCEVIMKCRTDQFVHNKDIFKIFKHFCTDDKIMIPNYATIKDMDYFASDFCQIAKKELLTEYWNSIKNFEGNYLVNHAEIYLTANYILRAKKDISPWEECLRKYYCVKGFHNDFGIQWEKIETIPQYKEVYDKWYPLCIDSERI